LEGPGQSPSPLPEPPRVFLISELADPLLDVEVHQQGGGDVITEPFDPEDIWRRIRSAWIASRRKSVQRAQSAMLRVDAG
jgi:DNA-binding response OmpR family regulator